MPYRNLTGRRFSPVVNNGSVWWAWEGILPGQGSGDWAIIARNLDAANGAAAQLYMSRSFRENATDGLMLQLSPLAALVSWTLVSGTVSQLWLSPQGSMLVNTGVPSNTKVAFTLEAGHYGLAISNTGPGNMAASVLEVNWTVSWP